MKVVIADDMGPSLRFLHRVMKQNGHDVVGQATNGLEAVQLCARFHPDLAILDNAMPKLTGMDAARAILAAKTAKHVIMVTTLTQAVVKKQLIAIGCKVVSKTDDETFLLRAIAEIEHDEHA